MPGRRPRFDWILRILPPSFREEFGGEILRTWRDEQRDADREGTRGVWRRALRDTLGIAPREHAAALARNLRFAARQLRRAPAFALTSILTLALGTGATASVFSLVNAVLLRPLPWQSPEAIGLVWAVPPTGDRTWLSFVELEELQRGIGTSLSVAGLMDLRPILTTGGVGHELQALAVSHRFFGILGVHPELGRDFVETDERDGAAPVAMVSHAFWRSRFGADPSLVGRAIVLDDRRYTVVGILPSRFELPAASPVLPETVDVWLPLEPHLASRSSNVRFLHALARVRPGASFVQANAELDGFSARLRAAHPAAYPGGPWGFAVVSFTGEVLKSARVALYLLFGLVLLVLVMASANVMHLLLARGEARRAEIAVRTALGAGPARLAGELLAEAFLLAAAGAIAGAAVATAAPAIARSIAGSALPRLDGAALDLRTGVFVAGLALLTLILVAVVPLLERLRIGSLTSVLSGRSGGRTRRSAAVSRALVIVQTTLATAIIATTLSLSETFVRLQQVDLGLKPDDVLTARITLSPAYPYGPRAAAFFDSATAAVAGVPGVEAAAAITQLPMSGSMLGSTFLTGPAAQSTRIDADLRGITPAYFDVSGTPLREGRTFTSADTAAGPSVAIVDELFARRLSPDGRVLGRRIRWFRQPDSEIEIVGVVGAVRHHGPSEPARETVYRPHNQYPRPSMFVVARTTGDAAAVTEGVRAAVAAVDPGQPFADVSTLAERVRRSVGRARTSLLLASVLGGLALALGAVGIYGVLSCGVAQRIREFGVRLALGATPSGIGSLVVKEGLVLTGAGAAAGVALSTVILAAVRSALPEAAGSGALPSVLGAVVVMICAAAAFWWPARRAARLDPLDALKSE